MACWKFKQCSWIMMGLKVQDGRSAVGYDVLEAGRIQIIKSKVLLYMAWTLFCG